jgi:hypothetical protein
MAQRPIENFDPLLRDLASYGLANKDSGEGRGWHLSEAAQSRLNELHDARRAAVRPENLVYLDHLCARCHTRGLTRLREGAYLCDDCSRQAADDPDATDEADEAVTNAG